MSSQATAETARGREKLATPNFHHHRRRHAALGQVHYPVHPQRQDWERAAALALQHTPQHYLIILNETYGFHNFLHYKVYHTKTLIY